MNRQRDDNGCGCIFNFFLFNFFPVIWAILCAWYLFENRDDLSDYFLQILVLGGALCGIYAVLLTALFAGVVYFFKIVVEIFAEIFSPTKLKKEKKKLEEAD